jgi:hypothetical protein
MFGEMGSDVVHGGPCSFAMSGLVTTRQDLQRVATHVLARRRHAVTGRFGLRATPAGFGTPAFGDDVEVLRVAGPALVRERGGDAAFLPLDGATLAELAVFAGVDLAPPFAVGADTPPLGDPGAPLGLDAGALEVFAGWYDLGWRVLEAVVAPRGPAARPSVVQLWPEHFDAACAVSFGPDEGQRCNLGVSPGDSTSDEPYLYVGPWGSDRPGDPAYWNAPFGAVLPRAAVLAAPDPLATAVEFFRTGLDRLESAVVTGA